MDVISVKFKGRGKIYYFDPRNLDVPTGAQVVVQTSKGLELSECIQGVHAVPEETVVAPLRPVVRLATDDDMRIAALCKQREQEAFAICVKKIAEHGLEMKLVDVECAFDGGKIMFFFTADGRVDFRALVKDLAGVFRTRIELRQIGVRDEAKMLGGIGMCGRPYCCHQFMNDFAPVSTKMAKTQSLSLNPAKISGCCGRLMCCLRYEQEAYEDLVRNSPKIGAFVETVAGYGNVAQVNLLRQTVKVKLDGSDNNLRICPVDEIAVIPGGRPQAGEPLPHLLEITPKPEQTSEEDTWRFSSTFRETAGDAERSRGKRVQQAAQGQKKSPQKQKKSGGQKMKAAGKGGTQKRKNRGKSRNKNTQ